MINAIFFDIDGTLVSFNTHTVPQSAIDAITEVRKKGIKVFIATGRSLMQIDNLKGLTIDGYITLNGGYCTTGTGKTIYKNGISTEDIKSLIRYQEEEEQFPCSFVCEDEIFVNDINDTVTEIAEKLNYPVPPLKDIRKALTKEIFQIVAYFDSKQESRIMQTALPHCHATRWNSLFTDVIAAGNSKQTGIDKIIAYYGINLNETMAFGDGGNDISMLRHAALSIAMGNANGEVKQAANYITDSVDENGIWNALKHFDLI